MARTGISELVLLVLLPAAIWVLGALWIRASDAFELRHARAARARRLTDRGAKPAAPVEPRRSSSL